MVEQQQPSRTEFWIKRLPKTQKLACSQRDIRKLFSGGVLGWVALGTMTPEFRGPSYNPVIRNSGPILASVAVGAGEPHLCLYAVRADGYPHEAAEDFRSAVLPKLREWLDQELAKPETLKFAGARVLVVEWAGDRHRFHQMKWH
jgi:hypothetical protein